MLLKLDTNPTFIQVTLVVKWGNLFLKDQNDEDIICLSEPLAGATWLDHQEPETIALRFSSNLAIRVTLRFTDEVILKEFRQYFDESSMALAAQEHFDDIVHINSGGNGAIYQAMVRGTRVRVVLKSMRQRTSARNTIKADISKLIQIHVNTNQLHVVVELLRAMKLKN